MSIFYGTIDLSSVLFDSTTSTASGGAVYVSATSGSNNFAVMEGSFIDNSAQTGGALAGVLGSYSSNIDLRDTTFVGNSTTTGSGGAVSLGSSQFGTQTTDIDNCIFAGNDAAATGGAISAANEPLRVRNSSFYDNAAGSHGGAVRATAAANTPTIVSSSFHQNSTGGSGGGISLASGAGAIVRNVVLWDNGTDMSGEASATITYTCSEEFLSIGVGNLISLTDPIVPGPGGELDAPPVDMGVHYFP